MPEKVKKVLLAPFRLLGLIFKVIGRGIQKVSMAFGKWFLYRYIFGKRDKKSRKIHKQEKKIMKQQQKIKKAKARVLKLQDQ